MPPDSVPLSLADAKEDMNALLCDYARDPDRPEHDDVNGQRLLMVVAGTMVEARFMFD